MLLEDKSAYNSVIYPKPRCDIAPCQSCVSIPIIYHFAIKRNNNIVPIEDMQGYFRFGFEDWRLVLIALHNF